MFPCIHEYLCLLWQWVYLLGFKVLCRKRNFVYNVKKFLCKIFMTAYRESLYYTTMYATNTVWSILCFLFSGVLKFAILHFLINLKSSVFLDSSKLVPISALWIRHDFLHVILINQSYKLFLLNHLSESVKVTYCGCLLYIIVRCASLTCHIFNF